MQIIVIYNIFIIPSFVFKDSASYYFKTFITTLQKIPICNFVVFVGISMVEMAKENVDFFFSKLLYKFFLPNFEAVLMITLNFHRIGLISLSK
jgi:hypothetical protein